MHHFKAIPEFKILVRKAQFAEWKRKNNLRTNICVLQYQEKWRVISSVMSTAKMDIRAAGDVFALLERNVVEGQSAVWAIAAGTSAAMRHSNSS